MILGDNYPRGINLVQWNDTSRDIQDLLRIKTEHGATPKDGIDVYTEISTRHLTFYKWSNDNRTYSELAGVVEMEDRLSAL